MDYWMHNAFVNMVSSPDIEFRTTWFSLHGLLQPVSIFMDSVQLVKLPTGSTQTNVGFNLNSEA